MPTIEIANLKCGGCENTIRTELAKSGLSDVEVNIANQAVSFSGDEEIAKKILTQLGYPPADSPEAARLSKKAKSFISCALGRIKK